MFVSNLACMSETAQPGTALRVLMVTPLYLPSIGGIERGVAEVTRRLAAAEDVTVRIVTTDRGGALPALERDGAVEVRRVPAYPRRADWMFAPGLPAAMAEGEWDIVHVQSYHTFVAPTAMATAARRATPYVLTFHGGGHSSTVRHEARVLQRLLMRPLLKRAGALIATAQFEIDEYAPQLRLPASKFRLIPSGVDLPEVPPGDQTEPREGGGPLVASIGRLVRYKGHQRVIAAFAHFVRQEPDARLLILGSGPYEGELRRLANSLGIAGLVEIVAVGPGVEMARRLHQVDLVVLLSEFETHPVAALEAIGLHRPLLVAEGSGLGELAARGLARAIALDASPTATADAMLLELREPTERGAVALPTWDDCAAELLALYREVVGRARKTPIGA